MIRFFIALWAAKLTALYFRIRGKKNDWAGVVAYKICPDFLAKIAKPKQVYCITGTDGKTTTSSIIANILKMQGYSVSFNYGGGNVHAGHILNLLRCVNIFNKPILDCSVLEADELTLEYTMGMIKPSKILVVNIAKDSIKRNAHPEYIFDRLQLCFDKLGDSTQAILNGCDPISNRLGNNSNPVHFGICDLGLKPYNNISKDIVYCPNCGNKIKYDYRLYRHIGGFHCDCCGYKNPEMKYYATAVDLENQKMIVKENDTDFTYSLFSKNLFNAFNALSIIAFFRELGYSKELIEECLKVQTMPPSRETCIKYNNVSYYAFACKATNVSAASIVFEMLHNDSRKKDVVLFLDEDQDRFHPLETASWIYETDYELLNSDNINRIIIPGHMHYYHEHRLLLAGVPKDKIFGIDSPEDVPKYVSQEGIEACYVLFEVDFIEKGNQIRDNIVSYIRGE